MIIPSQTAAVYFGNIRSGLIDSLNIAINGNKIDPCDLAKRLGVIIDSKVRFGQHINNSIISKCYMALNNLYHSRRFLTFGLKKRLCESLVLSYLNYADTIYGACLDFNSAARMQRVPNAFLRLIYPLSRSDLVSDTLAQLGGFNMEKTEETLSYMSRT
nr:unnamed protein product [Callosobruchus analis]